MESNTQGHGTIKKLRTGAVVSTLALTAFGVSTGVSANETEVAVNEPATRVVAKDEVVPKVPSQADVDKAKVESDKVNQDVAKQKEVVSTTEANIADAEKTIADTTKKVEEAKSVTPEKVAEAKADAEKKANELATAEKAVADADKSVSVTAEKVADQTKVVSNAEKTATATANKVADAQKKVDSLSSTTNVAPLEKEVGTLTNQVSADTQAVETAQTNLDNGKKAQSNKDQAIKDAQSGVSSAEAKLSQATTALANAKADQSNKDKAVNSAKSALDVAKQGVTETTTTSEKTYTIPKTDYTAVLSQGYIDAVKAYANGTGSLKDVEREFYNVPYEDEITGVGAKSLSAFNSTGKRFYKGDFIPHGSEDTDSTEIADFQHLTKDQQIRLTTYAASIINELRAKFGTKPVSVTDSSLMFGEVFNRNFNPYIGGHSATPANNNRKDEQKFKDAVEESGVSSPSSGIRVDGQPHFLGVGKDVKTMAQIKQVLFRGIAGALGRAKVVHADSSTTGFDSTLLLLGLREPEKTSLGAGIGAALSQLGMKYGTSLTFSAPQDVVTTTQKVDAKAVETAQKAYDDAVKASEEAKSTVSTA